jgi:hypothetical protein
MPERNEEYFSRWKGIAWLWAGVLAGPLAIALNQQLAYLVVTLNCSYGKTASVLPVMLLTLLIAGSGLFISWRNWRRTGRGWDDGGGDVSSRSRFLSIVGVLFSGFSLLTLFAMWLPIVFYRRCQR